MKATIVQIDNSQGIRIPKTILEQLEFEQEVELEVLPDGLLLRPALKRPRADWAEQFAAVAAAGEQEEFADWNQAVLTTFDEAE